MVCSSEIPQVHSILFVISITMLLWNYFFVRRESKQLRWYSFIFLLVISPRTLNEQNHYGLAVVYYPCNNNNLQNQKKTEKKDRKPFSYWDYTVLPYWAYLMFFCPCMLEILFIFSLFLFYFTAPPKMMPKSHPIITHMLIFLYIF